MRITVIDNSLCDSGFVPNVSPAEISAYMKYLLEYGASYVEMTTDTFRFLPPGTDHSKIILRLQSQDDLLFVNSFDFAYVLLPANMAKYACRIRHRIILELCMHGAEPLSIIDMFFKSFPLAGISMIRISDDFELKRAQMNDFIKAYRQRFMIPLDICPTDKKLTAVNGAISAVFARADSVTLRFGSTGEFAELQDYTLAITNLFSVMPSPEMLLALCKCAVLYKVIYGRNAEAATNSLRQFQVVPHRILNTDRANCFSRSSYPQTLSVPTPPKKHFSLLYKQLRRMRVDKENARDIEKAVDDFCCKLYKSEK